jgi:hypothetical protein
LDLVKAHSWKDTGYRGFGPVIVALSLFLLAWVTVAAFTGALWVIGIGLLFALTLPISYYVEARVKRKNLAIYGYLVIVLFASNVLFAFYYRPPPFPLLAWYLFGFAAGCALFIGISVLVCERFLKPRLDLKA